MTRTAPVSVVAALILMTTSLPGYADPTQEVLRQRVETLREAGQLAIGGSRIAAVRLIPTLYERRDFELAWNRPAMVQELMSAIAAVPSHGLDPADYHFGALNARLEVMAGGLQGATSMVDLDLLLTDALARLAFTLHFGKLDPTDLDPVWNLSRVLNDAETLSLFQETLETGDLAALLESVVPQNEYYENLRWALADYRSLAARGGWSTVPDGPILKPGNRDPRVADLRARLAVTGELETIPTDDPDLYDDFIEAAVIRFQRRHGLDEDGKLGPKTLAALNLPVEARIDQIRANLERNRWVFRDLPETFITVNIAGFELTFVRGGAPVWTTRVQVGKKIHETPIFASEMTYLVFNPTWTVPLSILRNETLPAIRKDPGYLEKQNMSIIRSDGSVVDPSTVDLNGSFPYGIRQEPGPNNALGRVKFMFPNAYSVYLHDTPSKSLFTRSERAFSHGCIRTENPIDLAELLLADKKGWTRALIDAVIESGTMTTVTLEKPVTVLLLYWTADVQPGGSIEFREDIYGRDARIIEGLNDTFEFKPPKMLPAALR